MTPQERQLIGELFDRLARLETARVMAKPNARLRTGLRALRTLFIRLYKVSLCRTKR